MVRLKLLTLAVLLVFVNTGLAYQYRDYVWGSPLKDVKEALKKEHNEIFSSETEKTVGYNKNIFDSPCEITFYFTDPNEFLCMVKFVWKTSLVGEKVLDYLVKNHGEPLQPDADTDRFAWIKESGESIALEVDDDSTKLYYSAGEASKTSSSDVEEKPDNF